MADTISQWILTLTLTLILAICIVSSSGDTDVQILRKFKSSLSNADALSDWNLPVENLCNGNKSSWAGLICLNGVFTGLQLEKMGLTGLIDIDSLMQLQDLRSLSLMNNNFDGPMPQIKKLGWLKSLFLSNNRFSGEIPDDAFEGMNSLKKVYMAQNLFSGRIPESLASSCPRLMELRLDQNQFEGKIPDFEQSGWRVLNLSNNHLVGRIPSSLSIFNASSFNGNKDLCGKPLLACKSSNKLIYLSILAIVPLLLAICVIYFICCRKRSKSTKFKLSTSVKETHKKYDIYEKGGGKEDNSSDQIGKYKRGESGKLNFVRNDRERFDLQDLLRASAEILGSGSFGSSYKATLMSGSSVVVKRFREMSNVGREEFHEHMRRLGSLSHLNLLPLVAFYYRKEEKLLVSDFVGNGSLASHLHARRAPGESGLDWTTRLKIIKGVAKGIEYLYEELNGLVLPHGHLKSSNVLLDHTFEPLLTDYALVPVINKEHAQQFMVAYKSPEFMQCDRTTKKTDVWSLGILILEMLTGKFPTNYLKQGKGANADLATWVNSVVREEWTGEVFDKDMKGTKNGEGEMLKLLKIGMSCCEWNVDKRWGIREAVEKIEELKERDSDEDMYSSYASEGDIYSSRALTDDDFSFSVTS